MPYPDLIVKFAKISILIGQITLLGRKLCLTVSTIFNINLTFDGLNLSSFFGHILQCQKKCPKIYFFYCFYEWKEGGQNKPPAIKYKGKKHPIKSKVNRKCA